MVNRVSDAMALEAGSSINSDQDMEDSVDLKEEMEGMDEPDDSIILGQFQDGLRKEALAHKNKAIASKAHKKGRLDLDIGRS